MWASLSPSLSPLQRASSHRGASQPRFISSAHCFGTSPTFPYLIGSVRLPLPHPHFISVHSAASRCVKPVLISPSGSGRIDVIPLCLTTAYKVKASLHTGLPDSRVQTARCVCEAPPRLSPRTQSGHGPTQRGGHGGSHQGWL